MTTNIPPPQPVWQTVEQSLQQAIACQQASQLQDAEKLYLGILRIYPDHSEANHNMGVLAVQMKQPAAGLPYFMAALDAEPACGQYWLNYIDALFQAGQLEDARQVLALAQQQGLEGEKVEALAMRLEGGTQVAEQPNAEEQHASKESPPVSSAAPQNSKKKLKTKPVKLDKSAGKFATHKGKSPSPQQIDTLVSLFTAGRFTEAATLAQAMTVRFPLHGFGWKVLGLVFKQMGRNADALAPMQKAAALSPSDAEAYNNLSNALSDLSRLDEAEVSLRRALEIKPDYAEAYSNLGATLQDLGRPDEAEASYRRALQIKPDLADAHYNLGNTLHDLSRLDEAEGSYRRALQIKPDYAEVHNNLGICLKDMGRLDEAVASCRRALQIKPDYAHAHNYLGIILKGLGLLDEAEASYRRALQIKPDYAEAHSNLGITLKELGRLDEAETSYRQALQIKPDFAEAHNNLGHALLATGRLSEGWKEYEYRWEGDSPKRLRPPTLLPQWTGQNPLPADRLLIFKEQGMGDQLQFSRHLPLAANRFADGVSIVADRPLLALFRRSFPDVEVLDAIPADQSAWQWQCPLLSLPLAFRATLATIPKQVPYLIPEPVRVACWQARIAELGLPAPTRKIGVVWKTGSFMKNAPMRTLTLQQLAPLLNLPGCVWFSLQKEPDTDKLPWVSSGKLIDWADEFNDFDDTAALAMNLDLIVSVDTAVVHLAGGLGRPTWLLNRHASEWRWLYNREDSPWYPTMRIFTQKTAGDWDEVVSRMAAALAGMPPPAPALQNNIA